MPPRRRSTAPLRFYVRRVVLLPPTRTDRIDRPAQRAPGIRAAKTYLLPSRLLRCLMILPRHRQESKPDTLIFWVDPDKATVTQNRFSRSCPSLKILPRANLVCWASSGRNSGTPIRAQVRPRYGRYSEPKAPGKPAALSQANPRGRTGRSIRTDRHRYTEWIHQGELVAVELYDHRIDPGENVNLASKPEHDVVVDELAEQFRALWATRP